MVTTTIMIATTITTRVWSKTTINDTNDLNDNDNGNYNEKMKIITTTTKIIVMQY